MSSVEREQTRYKVSTLTSTLKKSQACVHTCLAFSELSRHLTEGIGEEYQTDHDDGKDDRGYLQVFLEDTTVPDSTKALLLEDRGAVLVVMVMVMMLLFHISGGC